MKKQTFNIGDVVFIEWVDSHFSAGWEKKTKFEKEVIEVSNTIIKTVGFLFQKNDKVISVVQSMDNQIDGDYDSLMIIPRRCIFNIVKLKGNCEEKNGKDKDRYLLG